MDLHLEIFYICELTSIPLVQCPRKVRTFLGSTGGELGATT